MFVILHIALDGGADEEVKFRMNEVGNGIQRNEKIKCRLLDTWNMEAAKRWILNVMKTCLRVYMCGVICIDQMRNEEVGLQELGD